MPTDKPSLTITRAVLSLALSALTLATLISASFAQSTQRGGVDWILVLDTSASMRGAGGEKDIFDRVRSTIAGFIRSTREGDSVSLYTFDRDTKLRSNVRITGEIDKRDLLKVVDELQPTGDRTYTAKAIHDALERASELKTRPDSIERTVSIVLFTDGLEDVRGIANPITIPSNISLIPKDPPYMFFVSLGAQAHEKQLEDFVKDSALGGRGEVIRDPGATGIAEVGDRIRKKIETPPPRKEAKFSIQPASLDFGEIESGETTSPQTIYINSDATVQTRLRLDDSASSEISLVEPTEALALKAGETAAVKVRLKGSSTMADGRRAPRLFLIPEGVGPNLTAKPVTIDAQLNVISIPVWRKAIKWILLLLLLGVLVVVAISVVKGEPPWLWLGEIGPDKKLEGEIEIIQPRPAKPEEGFISLTQRRTNRVSLSSLASNGAMEDSDAELTAERRNGHKSVLLRRLQGDLRVNETAVASTEIYDGDIIELGKARFRFNWIGHDRQVESDENT